MACFSTAEYSTIFMHVSPLRSSQIRKGIQKTAGDTTGGAKYPQGIWCGDAKFPRVYCSGMPYTREAKSPMTPAVSLRPPLTR